MLLKSLVKSLDFSTKEELFNYAIDSYINGQFGQCRQIFLKMYTKDRKAFLEYISGCYDNHTEKEVYKFYFDLLFIKY